MRAYFYFRLAIFRRSSSYYKTDGDRTVPRASYTETFAQITSDLKLAIETLPATPLQVLNF
jgi:hypothetical protein